MGKKDIGEKKKKKVKKPNTSKKPFYKVNTILVTTVNTGKSTFHNFYKVTGHTKSDAPRVSKLKKEVTPIMGDMLNIACSHVKPAADMIVPNISETMRFNRNGHYVTVSDGSWNRSKRGISHAVTSVYNSTKIYKDDDTLD